MTGAVRVLLGLVTSAGFGYVALAGLDPEALLHQIGSARILPLATAVALAVAASLVRAERWRVLLGDRTAAGYGIYFRSMMIGYLVNNLLPARLGEAVRIVVLVRRTRISTPAALGSVVLERTLDLLLLLMIAVPLSLVVPVPDAVRRGGGVAFVAVLGVAAALVAMAARSRGNRGGGARWTVLVGKFTEGLAALRSSARFGVTALLTVTIWALEVGLVAFVLVALGLPASVGVSIVVLALIALGSLVPAAPAGLGTYEFLVIVALTAFGIAHGEAAGAAVVLHTVTLLTSVAIGFLCLSVESLSLRDLAGTVREAREAKA